MRIIKPILLGIFEFYLNASDFCSLAMYGHNFCRAGEQAFKMLSSNALRVIAINSVGDFVLWLGKALVVIATVLIGVEMLQVRKTNYQ